MCHLSSPQRLPRPQRCCSYCAAQVQYALEGSVAVAGLGISWLKDNLGLIDSPQESEELAR